VLKTGVIADRALETEVVATRGPASSDQENDSRQMALYHLVHEQPQMEAGNISVSIFFFS